MKKKTSKKLIKILAEYVVYCKQPATDLEAEIMNNPKLSRDSDYKSGLIFFINGFLAGEKHEQANKSTRNKKKNP